MSSKKIVISLNAAWNIYNFRLGLIRGLEKAGHEVIAVAPEDAYSPRLTELGVQFEPIAMEPAGMSPAQDIRLALRYYRLFKRLKPDIYLGYTIKPNIYGSLAAQMLGIPVINNVAGLGTVFSRDTFLTKLASMLYRTAFKRSFIVFFQNDEDRSLFIDKGLVRPELTRILPGSGVDLARFAPGKAVAERTGFTFLLIARMLWEKGVGEYVEAARSLRREDPSLRFQLLGFLDMRARKAIPRETMEEWVEEGVIEYLGEADDVRPYLEAADCVVLPSRYREGVPRSLLEAAAMAKPLIATDTPGCRDIVRPGVNGLLCATSNSASLADAMRQMVAFPAEERQKMGQQGRALVEERFSEEVVVRAYLDAIAAAS